MSESPGADVICFRGRDAMDYDSAAEPSVFQRCCSNLGWAMYRRGSRWSGLHGVSDDPLKRIDLIEAPAAFR